MRHRKRGVKRDHSVIPGLVSILEEVARISGVTSVIPGRISRTKRHAVGCTLRIQLETGTGVKCLAYSGCLVQEVFVTTGAPAAVMERLRVIVGP